MSLRPLLSGLARSAPLLLAAVVAAGAAQAATDPPPRYSMSPADGGFVRLDTETGEMAFCKRAEGEAWACQPMRDGQQADRTELDRLRQENEALRRGQPVPPPVPPGDQDGVPPGAKMPSEEDVDRLFDYVEGMARKLKERLQRLEEAKPKGEPL